MQNLIFYNLTLNTVASLFAFAGTTESEGKIPFKLNNILISKLSGNKQFKIYISLVMIYRSSEYIYNILFRKV